MVESLALRIAQAIKRVDPEKTASVEVMKFSLEAIMNTLVVIVLVGVAGLVTSTFAESMLAFGAFAFLRFFSGGLHMRKALHCSIVSTLLIASAPHIPLNESWMWGIGTLSAVLVLIYAPSNIEGQARIPSKYFIYLKLISIAIVLSNFLIMNDTVCVVFAIQAATLIRLQRR
ncbi:accessory gene regulator ArgB-like protein [Cohnella candidum]|nr:accessory gene regulator B family protein [Cohnella candidum]